MKTEFAPKHYTKIANSYILWFEVSNQYIVISNPLMSLLEIYFNSEREADFEETLRNSLGISEAQSKTYYAEISDLLKTANTHSEKALPKKISASAIVNAFSSETYDFGKTSIRVNFGSAKVKELIHPQLSYARIDPVLETTLTQFDIFHEGDHIFLFRDKTYIGHYNVLAYHLLQGQFALEVINTLYQKQEKDWIGTFHASTVCNDKEAIMLVGDSGNGKSTLAALLFANGFDVLADDFTPLAAKNNHVYRFPAGISVKQGAFELMENALPSFKNLPTFCNVTKQVNVKYIPPSKSFNKSLPHLPCTKIVYVKYDANSKSTLKAIETDQVLPTLIPDSWLSPLAPNAQLFLDWLKQLQCYELNYSDNSTAISAFKKLFNNQ